MDIDDIKTQLDRIETKLDDHLERLSKAEEAIVWMRGNLKLVIAVVIAVLGSVLLSLWNKLIS